MGLSESEQFYFDTLKKMKNETNCEVGLCLVPDNSAPMLTDWKLSSELKRKITVELTEKGKTLD